MPRPCLKLVLLSLCSTLPRSPMAKCIWRSWAPLKCKIFAWLAMQYRIWTSDRRARHGLQDEPSPCYTCLQDQDDADHILSCCTYAREVWCTIWDTIHIDVNDSLPTDTPLQWWLRERGNFHRADMRGFDTLFIATMWSLWKQRNARVYNRIDQQMRPREAAMAILGELAEWKQAVGGVGGLQRFVRE